MVASVVFHRPQRTYEALRTSGTEARALPWQLPVLLAHELGLPPLVSGRFLPEKPAVGAVGIVDGQWEWMVAFRVQSGAELVAELSTGSSARFESERRGEVTLLRGAERTLAVVDSSVGLASSEQALERYAVYLARADLVHAGDSHEADVSLGVTSAAGGLLDTWLDHALARGGSGAGALVAAATRSNDVSKLVVGEPWSSLVSGLAATLRAGVRTVSGGTLRVQVSGRATRLSGELAVTGPAVAPSAEGVTCGRELDLPEGVGAAALLPREVLAARNVARPSESQAANGARATRSNWEEFSTLVSGPVLVAAAAASEPRWLLQTRLSDPKGVTEPLAWLSWGPFGRLLAPRRFSGRAAPGRLEGSLTSSGPTPAWQLSWSSAPEVTSWALGVETSAWLESSTRVNAARLFPSWASLCDGEPSFAFGFAQRSGQLDLACSRREHALRAAASLPTPLLFDWLLSLSD
jgi:hypothetical protein